MDKESPLAKRQKPILVLAWFLFSLSTGYITLIHVPWRDEAYAWLIAREVPWGGIYGEAGANGAPSLWYYILAIPAKLGLPYGSMQAIHWGLACITAGLFLAKAPFHWALRIGFTFTQYIAYEHSVMARPYLLTLLFMWAACAWQEKKKEHPIAYGVILAFLANTSFFGVLAALYFIADNCVHERYQWRSVTARQKVAFAIMIAGLLPAVIGYVPPSADEIPYHRYNFYYNHPSKFIEMIYAVYIPLSVWKIFPQWVGELLRVICPFLSVATWIAALHYIEKRRAFGAMAFLGISWYIIAYIVAFKYQWPSPRHYSFCIIYLVMCLWLAMEGRASIPPVQKSNTLPKILTLLLGVSWSIGMIATLNSFIIEQKLPYSGSRAMAQFMLKKGLDKAFITSDRPELAIAILPYMPDTALWDPIKEKFTRYSHSNQADRRYFSLLELMNVVKRNGFDQKGDVYLLTFDKREEAEKMHFKLIYESHGINEYGYLFKWQPPH